MAPWFLLALVAGLFLAAEVFVYHRNPRRSSWRFIDRDRVAIRVGIAWWVCAISVSWVNDDDPLGGAVFGAPGAAIVACMAAGARRLIHAMRQRRKAA
ncbi:hypothetical protein ACFXOK_15655 [Streptomyces sp. NPDC059173]|uniref:hypothetical protein n=1 Tax=Streptomyces sp. NPDC059173 TaxID=3346756 RepID=UPI003679E5D8